MNLRNTTKMVEHKLILFVTARTLWTLVNLLIKLFRILLKWKYIQDQHYTFWSLSGESVAILSKIPGWSVHMGKFSSRLQRSRSQKPRSRASPASHMNTSIFLQRKEWRGEISETEPARLTGLIKRPLEAVFLHARFLRFFVKLSEICRVIISMFKSILSAG